MGMQSDNEGVGDIIYRIGDLLSGSERVIIVSHSRADGDALGSMLAIGLALRERGKDVRCVIFEELSARYRFLANNDLLFVLGRDISVDELHRADMLLVLDTAVKEQLEPINEFMCVFRGKTIIIDHHSHYDVSVVPDVVWQDKGVSASGILVARLLDRLGWLDDSVISDYLLLAIGSDTGWFRYNNTDAESFYWAYRLVSGGAEARRLYERLFLSYSPERFKLLARAMNSVEFYSGHRIVCFTLMREDFEQTLASESDTENIIDEACRVESFEVAVLFVEQDSNMTRISFRSRGNIDVNSFAKRYGGGGHSCAAGVRIDCSVSEAKRMIISALSEMLEGMTEY